MNDRDRKALADLQRQLGELLRREDRLARIESLLEQLLREKRAQRRKGERRRSTVIQRSAARSLAEPPEYQPTDLQRARVRRALQRLNLR